MLCSRLAFLLVVFGRRAKKITTAASEYKFARSPVIPSPSSINLLQQRNYLAHPHQSNSYITLQTHSLFPSKSQIRQICLPRPLKRSPPPAERHLPAEKHLLRRRRRARKPQRLLATRRSATRQERRHTLLTSTKVLNYHLFLPSRRV